MQNSELQGKMGVRWWKSIGQTGLFSQQTSRLRKKFRIFWHKINKNSFNARIPKYQICKGHFPREAVDQTF